MKGAGGQKAKRSRGDPRFFFFLETIRQPVTPKHPAWSRPLPLSRCAFSETSLSHLHPDESISVGDYFQAVRSFLQGAGRDAIATALEKRGVVATAPQIFRVFLTKHGEYYHPARVETDSGGSLLHWVVNVAVSSAGKSLLLKEYAILKRLNREFPVSYLPEVYAASEADAGHGRSVALFMGEWLSGFHEFHLARDSPDSEPALVLWDPENGRLRMDSGQAAAIYHQVARILTHYFNLATFEGIGGWHHAAGDFVVKVSRSQPEVRLITVRDYRPLFRSRQEAGDEIPDLKTLLQALLIFLLNLGIRTRLDRMDGTGEMAWSDPVAVEATVAGVLAVLSKKSTPYELPLPMDQLFRHYLAACAAEDLLEMCRAIAPKAFPLFSPEHPLLENRLQEHVAMLAAVLSRL
jgi:hypothetical protein